MASHHREALPGGQILTLRRGGNLSRLKGAGIIHFEPFAGNGIGQNCAGHHSCMDFQKRLRKRLEDEPLARKDNSFEIPVGNICYASNLNFTGGIDVAAEDLPLAIRRERIEDLSHWMLRGELQESLKKQ
jgi:hypothetical protein